MMALTPSSRPEAEAMVVMAIAEINAAFDLMRRGESIRSVVIF